MDNLDFPQDPLEAPTQGEYQKGGFLGTEASSPPAQPTVKIKQWKKAGTVSKQNINNNKLMKPSSQPPKRKKDHSKVLEETKQQEANLKRLVEPDLWPLYKTVLRESALEAVHEADKQGVLVAALQAGEKAGEQAAQEALAEDDEVSKEVMEKAALEAAEEASNKTVEKAALKAATVSGMAAVEARVADGYLVLVKWSLENRDKVRNTKIALRRDGLAREGKGPHVRLKKAEMVRHLGMVLNDASMVPKDEALPPKDKVITIEDDAMASKNAKTNTKQTTTEEEHVEAPV